ncbi:MAG TPA: hypothetical protein VIL26_03910 [Clostridia bacterium]
MLDKQTKLVLKKIGSMVSGEEYIIIKLSELKSALPFQCDNEGLAASIKFLQKEQMVAVKYSDIENVCLTVLPAGRIYLEEQEAAVKKQIQKVKKGLLSGLGVFFAAMLGTIVGQAIIKLFELIF